MIEFAGHQFIPCPSGALLWPSEKMLIISDLHFEKGSSYAARGAFLPPYDTAATIEKLMAVCTQFSPETIVFLGDVFHDRTALERMQPHDRAQLEQLSKTYNMIWIEGNHDAGHILPGVTGHYTATIKGVCFNHITTETDGFEISGHYHPCVKLTHKSQSVRRPCFVVTQKKLVMPSFGSLTGGLDIQSGVFQQAIDGPYAIHVLGPAKVRLL